MGILFPIDRVRSEFPILHQQIYKRPLVYFDNAASTQKPVQVIDAIRKYYEVDNCNIHRGVHYLSVKATEAYEEARKDFTEAIRLDPRQPAYYLHRGFALEALGKKDEAAEDFRRGKGKVP